MTGSDNCPPSRLLGWSVLMSFACVYMYVRSPGDEPRSRTQTDTQTLPTELHPQWVCVSRWALSFLTRLEASTGGWRDGGREGDSSPLWSFEEGRWALQAWTAASLRSCRCLSLPIYFSSAGFCLSFTLFNFLSLSWLECSFSFPLPPSSRSRFLLRGLASLFIIVLKVQSNAKLLKHGTSPTLSLLCLH